MPRFQASCDIGRVVDADAAQAEQLGVAGVREGGQRLAGVVARLALGLALLPGHLGEVAVVEHADDEARVRPVAPAVCHRDQLGESAHLHRAVAGQRDERAVAGAASFAAIP